MLRTIRSRRAQRAVAITALTLIAVAAGALPASAHVTVSADDSSKGADDAILTFRVPNEMDNATSMKLDVRFPVTTPLAEVDPEPKAGYTITTKMVTFNPPLVTDDGTIKTGVGEVTWTANSTAAGIPVGDFDSFRVLVGPLPTSVDQLAFPALQTYSNGQVISWTDPTTDPNNPPEHPAALLTLTSDPDAAPASATPSAAASSPSAVEGTPAAATPSTAPVVAVAASGVTYATKSEANTGKTLGIVGIIVGALGLLIGGAGLARGRKAN